MQRESTPSLHSRSEPLVALRRDRPDLFQSPPHWRSTLADIEQAAESIRRGEVQILGQSAGGRDIHAFAYGSFEPQQPTATISSAMASDRPAAFFDPARRTRPAMLLIGTIHGGEAEGIALCSHLIALMETGRDLAGREHPELLSLLMRVRLVIVPCLNPDGRERAAIHHLHQAELEHLFLVQQGIRLDNTPLQGRAVKETQPITPQSMRFLGGYYNDHGVNLQHDDFFGSALAPENQALLKLIRREIPDGFLTFHGHGSHPAFVGPDAYISPGYQRRQVEVESFISARLVARDINVQSPQHCVSPPWSFYFQTYFHHACGALPLLFEFPQGLRSCPYSLQSISDIGLTVVQGWAEYALRFGLRPASMDLFGDTSKA